MSLYYDMRRQISEMVEDMAKEAIIAYAENTGSWLGLMFEKIQVNETHLRDIAEGIVSRWEGDEYSDTTILNVIETYQDVTPEDVGRNVASVRMDAGRDALVKMVGDEACHAVKSGSTRLFEAAELAVYGILPDEW